MNRLDAFAGRLAALGLDPSALAPVAQGSIPARAAEGVAQGFGPTIAVDVAALLERPNLSGRLEVGGLPESLVAYDELGHDAAVVLESTGGRLRLLWADEPDPAVAASEQVVVIDAGRLRAPFMICPEGLAEAVFVGPGGSPTVRLDFECFVPPLVTRPAPVLTADVAAWARDDAWLAERAGQRLAAGDPFEVALAVGASWRLRRRRPEDERALCAALAAGRDTAAFEPERGWAAVLPAAARAWLEDAGVLACDRVETALQDVLELPELEEPLWRAGVLEACRLREELAGLLLVLRAAGGGDALSGALAAVDRVGRTVLRALPGWPRPADDEALRRARAVEPEAWWVLPVAGAR